MTYVITEKCVGTCDTACVEVCPVDCIHGPVALETLAALDAETRVARYPQLQLFIDPDECLDCDACRSECPVEAIYPDVDLPARYAKDLERNRRFFAERAG